MTLQDLEVMAYILARTAEGAVLLERAGSSRWAIRRGHEVLSHAGLWVHEPMPSSRSEAFLREHTFATAEHALAWWLEEYSLRRTPEPQGEEDIR